MFIEKIEFKEIILFSMRPFTILRILDGLLVKEEDN